jgi:hypothetical protein
MQTLKRFRSKVSGFSESFDFIDADSSEAAALIANTLLVLWIAIKTCSVVLALGFLGGKSQNCLSLPTAMIMTSKNLLLA